MIAGYKTETSPGGKHATTVLEYIVGGNRGSPARPRMETLPMWNSKMAGMGDVVRADVK